MTHFIENKKGLKDKHKEEDPLFEKKYLLSEDGKKMVSRLYRDGSLYYLTDKKDVSGGEKIKSSWNCVSTVHEEGARMVKDKLQECCQTDFSTKDEENYPGATSWRFLCGDKFREIIIKGTPEGKEQIFSEIDYLISSMMDKIP
jgi:hypothetical protein